MEFHVIEGYRGCEIKLSDLNGFRRTAYRVLNTNSTIRGIYQYRFIVGNNGGSRLHYYQKVNDVWTSDGYKPDEFAPIFLGKDSDVAQAFDFLAGYPDREQDISEILFFNLRIR